MNRQTLYIHATSLVSGCGTGWAAHDAALRAMRSGLAPNDFAPAAELATWIGRVAAADNVALPAALESFTCRNNQLALMALQSDGVDDAVRSAVARYGSDRLAVFVGSSTSGILATELAWRAAAGAPQLAEDYYAGRHNMFATARFIAAWAGARGPAMTISTACSSSAKVFAAARRAIRAGRCDAAIVAGVDSLALSTLHGFRSLQLLAATPCQPFAATRSGLSIGEAAGVALVSAEPSAVHLAGVGESSDAHHMSTPPPDGAGAQRAMRLALDDACCTPAAIDYINLHGTGTPANDSSEAAAVHAVFGATVPASSTKGYTGHTLGAAGAVEALLAMHALRNGFIPGNLGGAADPALPIAITAHTHAAPLTRVLSNSFGFGGSNCTLVFART